MGRHERRRDLRNFRRDASSASLLTFLLEPGDERLSEAPLLKAAARDWLDALSTRCRHCLICNSWIVSRDDVGALLLSTPATINPTCVGTAAVCRECWSADLPAAALERAVEQALSCVIKNGKLEPLDARR